MPDVTITCPSCGKTITVSEFVDLSQMICRACGSGFAPSKGESQKHGNDAAQEEQSSREPVVTFSQPDPVIVTARVKPRQRKLFRWTYQVRCWAVFACVGVVFLALRYAGILGSDTLDILVEYGPLAVFALHFYVTFHAFRESVMSGILSLLVPFYSLYYAFWLFEDYMFRAVFAGILLGTGIDTLVVMRDYAGKILPSLDEFLNRGM